MFSIHKHLVIRRPSILEENLYRKLLFKEKNDAPYKQKTIATFIFILLPFPAVKLS